MRTPIKQVFLLTAVQNKAKRIPMGLVLAAAVMLPNHEATAIPTVLLGTSGGFAVLAGSGITVAGAVNTTTINGDIGTFPTPSITGLGNVTLNGVNHADDAVTQQAKNDLVTAYNAAAGRTPVTTVVGDTLGGLFLPSGIYGGGALDLTGTLTLMGDANSVWIFQAQSTLITASSSSVVLSGGAQACNVFWQVGSSATLGTSTDFQGHILALDSITLNTSATVVGGVFARNGAVTLDNNTITASCCDNGGTGGNGGGTTVPDSGSTLFLLGSGLAALLGFRLRFVSMA